MFRCWRLIGLMLVFYSLLVGSASSSAQGIALTLQPAPGFPTVVFAGYPAQFPLRLDGDLGSNAVCTWDWGDGSAATTAPCHTAPTKNYQAPSTHFNSVTLTVRTSDPDHGRQASFSATIVVLPAISVAIGGSNALVGAQFVVLPLEPDADQTPLFKPMVLAVPLAADNSASIIMRTLLPLICAWDFGDGTSSGLAACSNVYHHYAQPSSAEGYPVTLTVAPVGAEPIIQVTSRLTVHGPSLRRSLRLPSAALHLDFRVDPGFAHVGQHVTFSPEASTLGVIAFAMSMLHLAQSPPGEGCLWDFGDGPTPSFPEPITLCSTPAFHAYQQPGSYRAELTLILAQDSPAFVAHRIEVSGTASATMPAESASVAIKALIARAVPGDPAGVSDPDARIGDQEIQYALSFWTTGRPLPGTAGLTIDDQTMVHLVALWAQGAPVL